MFKNSRAKGFTLVELLVVIAIIGILSSIISVSLLTARAKGRDAKRIADTRTIQLALETYYNDNLVYPLALSTLVTGGYLPSQPVDPKDNVTTYAYYALGVKQGAIAPCNSTYPAVAYHLGAGLEDSTNPALKQDVNQASTWSSMGVCQGTTGYTSGFNGKGTTSVNSTGAVTCQNSSDVGVGVTSQCYDLTN